MARLSIEGRGDLELGARTCIGSDPAMDLVLAVRGVAAHHVTVQRTAEGFRALAGKGTAGIVVNGERCARAVLADGDVLQLGSITARFFTAAAAVEPVAAAPVSSAPRRTATPRAATPRAATPRAATPRDGASRRRRVRAGGGTAEPLDDGLSAAEARRAERQRPKPKPYLAIVAVVMSCAVLGYALWQLAGARFAAAPGEALISLAETQLDRGQLARARSSLEAAAAVGVDPEELARLRERLAAMSARQGATQAKSAAGVDLQSLVNFERAYLLRDPDRREAARELVRRVDRWLAQHAAVFSDGDPDLATAETMRARYRAAAALGEPDTVDDVLFLARHHARVRPRRYRDALSTLERFLETAPSPDDAATVRELQKELLLDAEAWFAQTCERVRLLLRRGELTAARADLQHLQEQHLPEHAATVSRLQAAFDDAGR